MLVGLFRKLTDPAHAHRYALNVTLLLVSVAIALNAFSSVQNGNAQRDTCRQVETLKMVIYKQVQASANLLGKKGTAGYAYYHVHPDELANAKRQLTAELSAFGPRPCT